MKAARALRSYTRSVLRLGRWLNNTLSFEEARRCVERRLETRAESFLRLVRRCVFDNPDSPYLPLLKAADCGYEDLARGVRRHGLEQELARLKKAGVQLSLDEFKARIPVVRGDLEVTPAAEDFDNPIVSPIVIGGSGGSSGRPVRSIFDLDQIAVMASYQAFFLKLLGLYGSDLSVWYSQLPAPSGIVHSLMYAKLAHGPVRWFDTETGGLRSSGPVGRLLTAGLVAASGASRNRLAMPEPGPPSSVLRWLIESRDRDGRAALHSYVSRAVLLCRLAVERGESLEEVTFHLGGEPLTPARWREIRASGADGWPRYASTEMGIMAVGCTDPADIGDLHLCRDLVAVVAGERSAPRSPAVLYLTSLHETSPKVMINVELGDCARLERRRCGCLFGQMGLDLHLRAVHSTARVTCGGMTVAVSELIDLVEHVLRPRYGGGPLDYQWVEEEDGRGRSRVLLYVAPAIGEIDPERLVREILGALSQRSQAGRIASATWGAAGTIGVVRESPQVTAAGKVLPFLRRVES